MPYYNLIMITASIGNYVNVKYDKPFLTFSVMQFSLLQYSKQNGTHCNTLFEIFYGTVTSTEFNALVINFVTATITRSRKLFMNRCSKSEWLQLNDIANRFKSCTQHDNSCERWPRERWSATRWTFYDLEINSFEYSVLGL